MNNTKERKALLITNQMKVGVSADFEKRKYTNGKRSIGGMEAKSTCNHQDPSKQIQRVDAFSLLETVNRRTNENAIMHSFSAWVFKGASKWCPLSFYNEESTFSSANIEPLKREQMG